VIDVDAQAQTAHLIRKIRLIAANRTHSISLSKSETNKVTILLSASAQKDYFKAIIVGPARSLPPRDLASDALALQMLATPFSDR
jgi:hypothetical protein